MKDKYNIDININKILVGGYIFSYNPICKVEFIYNNNKYYAFVDTLKGLDSIYDNYQYKDIEKGISDYINDKIGVTYSEMKLYYNSDIPFLIPYNLNEGNSMYLTNVYFNGKNYNELLKDGRIDLTYDVDVIDESKIKEVFKIFPKSLKYNIDYRNKEVEKEDYIAKDITCTYKGLTYDGKVYKAEEYRLDFGKIRGYGQYETLKGANIVKTEPFDLKLINDFDSNKYKIISDFYRTSCSTIKDERINFHFPVTKKYDKYYSLGIKSVDKNGKVNYGISEAYSEEDGNYISMKAHCLNLYNEYVLLEYYN